MSKKKKPIAKINVKGLTLDDLLNYSADEINHMNRADLARVAGRLFDIANKRISALQKSDLGQLSPALASRTKSVKGSLRQKGIRVPKGMKVDLRFSVKGLDANNLRKQWVKAKNFIESKTSTIKGVKEIDREMQKRIDKISDESFDKELTAKQSRRLWKLFRKVYSEGGVKLTKSSDQVYESIRRMVQSSKYIKNDDIIAAATKRVDEAYDRMNKVEGKGKGTAIDDNDATNEADATRN